MKLLFLLFLHVYSTVVGIDYGTDWIKVSVIKPGGVIETVLNRESKRKTNNVLNIRNDIRSYGIEASNLGTRFPQGTFPNLKQLLGKVVQDEEVKRYIDLHSNVLTASSRNTVQFEHESKKYQVEELVAMLLSHARKQAEEYTSIAVSGAVITIPPQFTIFERQAILDAAEVANVRVYALIHDETAVAINFAVGKQFPKKEYHIFYDMGAGTTVATLASFHSGQDKKQGKNLVDLEIKGHAVEELGGQMIDLRLQKHLAQEFMNLHGKKLEKRVFDDAKAMARLLKEANRCKTILSANQNVMASLENLLGFDFKVSVSRKTLDKLNQDLFEKVTSPIQKVLDSANVTLDNVKSLVLFGGGVRVPGIQKRLVDFVGQEKIARNVDGDEAAVLGAVLHAAKVSASFRLGQTVRVKDLNPVPIQVSYESEKSGKVLNTVLFTSDTNLGARKLMTFKRTTDFDIDLGYRENGITPIVTVKVTGLNEAMAKYKDKMKQEPKVKVQIGLNDSGMLFFSDATATFEIAAPEGKEEKPDSIKDSVLNFFGKKKEGEKADDKGEKEGEAKQADEEQVEEEIKMPKEKVESNKVVMEKVSLKLSYEWKTIAPLTMDEKMEMSKRLKQMDHEDEERSKLETARNQLESYIYKCKELTWEDDIEEFTKETELEQLKELASELGEWLDDHMDTGKTSEFIEQKEKLVVVAGPIFTRRSEFSQRPVQVENLEIGLTTTEKAIEHLNSILNETVLTQEELDTFTKDVKEVRDWYTETSEKQSKLLKSDNPVLIVKDLKEKQKSLRKLAKRIDPAKLMKPKPKEPKSSKDFTDQELENLKKSGLSKEDIDKILKELKQKEDKAKAESESDKAASDKAASDKTASDKAEPTTEEPQEHTEL